MGSNEALYSKTLYNKSKKGMQIYWGSSQEQMMCIRGYVYSKMEQRKSRGRDT